MIIQNTTLVITLYNEAASIAAFLTSYKAQTAYPQECIVVDGGSTDNTVSILEQFKNNHPQISLTIIIDDTANKKHRKSPIAYGRNIGIAQAKHENIITTDGGCILHKDWFKTIAEDLIKNNRDVIGGIFDIYKVNEFQEKVRDIFIYPISVFRSSNFIPSSRNFGFKKQCWEDVGGYPEDVDFCGEDYLFVLNLKKKYTISFNENAIVYWCIPKNKEEAYKNKYSYGFGDGQIRKYLPKRLLGFMLSPLNALKKSKGNLSNFWLYQTMLYKFYKGYLDGYIKGRGK